MTKPVMGHLHVSLTLWGERLIPAEISKLLGLAATYSRDIGETSGSRHQLRADLLRLGMWHRSDAFQLAGESTSALLRQFCERIGDRLQMLRARKLVDQARLSVMTFTSTNAESWEDELDNDVLLRIAALGVSLRITLLTNWK